MLTVFAVTACLWIFSSLLKGLSVGGVAPLAGLSDAGIAMLAATALFLILACTLGASSAYMMPVGTPPNAIVFRTGLIRLPQMMKAGFWMNLAGILVITALVTLFTALMLGSGPTRR